MDPNTQTHHCPENEEHDQAADELSKWTHPMWIYFPFHSQHLNNQKTLLYATHPSCYNICQNQKD